ncbi:MAG: hypothetical protein HYU69_12180 [Bacteroidetes bacterium]|nr:hypothetical protein [Bacteroidota bacterium]
MWLENGIMCAKYKSGIVIDLKIAKDIVNDRKTLSEGITRPMFVDITELLYIDPTGRKFLASHEACELLCAGAIFTKNKLLAILGNAFIMLDEPLIPSKVFSNREEALKWLKSFQ